MRRAPIVIALVLVAAACGGGDKNVAGGSPRPTDKPKKPVACGGSELRRVREGTLTVGADIAYPPFEFVDQRTQKPVGFDVDVLTEIARRNRWNARFTNQTFSGVIAGLLARKYDAVASAMTITDDRRAQVCFSDPYLDADQALTVNAKRAAEVRSSDDLAGKVVGVQAGTTGDTWANEHLQGKAKEIRAYETSEEAFEDLKAGQVDGVVDDLPLSLYRARQDGGIVVIETIRTGERYGIAVHPENKPLLDKVNAALKAMRQDGTYDRVHETWFGRKPEAKG